MAAFANILRFVMGIALLTFGIGCSVVNDIQAIGTAGDSYMTALMKSDFANAYSLSHPSLQKDLGNADKLKAVVDGANVHPTKWNFTNRSVNGDEGVLDGDVTFTGDKPGTLQIVLHHDGAAWKVAGFSMKAK